MPRLTVTLSDDIYRALKETAARRDVPMRQIIEESLEFSGVKSSEDARELVARARDSADLEEQDALDLAVEETRNAREAIDE
ncbi:MAG: ribbon-helix-helix protein, CopG family [Bradymonadaceae bacterium]